MHFLVLTMFIFINHHQGANWPLEGVYWQQAQSAGAAHCEDFQSRYIDKDQLG